MEDDVDPSGDSRSAARVVKVEVTEHQEVDLPDAQPVETGAQWFRVGAGVDEGHLALGTQHDRVSLPHVTHGDAPLARIVHTLPARRHGTPAGDNADCDGKQDGGHLPEAGPAECNRDDERAGNDEEESANGSLQEPDTRARERLQGRSGRRYPTGRKQREPGQSVRQKRDRRCETAEQTADRRQGAAGAAMTFARTATSETWSVIRAISGAQAS